MARARKTPRRISQPRPIVKPMRLPSQYGAGAKVTAPPSGYSGNYPSTGRTAPFRQGTKATGRYPA